MSPEAISAVAGTILSLVLNYTPGLNTAFDRLSANGQRATMGLLLALSAVGLALWTCTGPDALSASTASLCTDGGINWRAVVQSFIFALMANQAADRISPKVREDEKRAEQQKAAQDGASTTPTTPASFRSMR